MTVLNTSKPRSSFFCCQVPVPNFGDKAAMPKGHGGFPLCPVLCRAGRWPWVLQRNMYLQRSDGKKSGKFADTKIYYIILHYIAISYVITLINENDNDRQYVNMTVWHGHGTTSKCANSMWWCLPSNQTNPSLQSVLWFTEILIKSNTIYEL